LWIKEGDLSSGRPRGEATKKKKKKAEIQDKRRWCRASLTCGRAISQIAARTSFSNVVLFSNRGGVNKKDLARPNVKQLRLKRPVHDPGGEVPRLDLQGTRPRDFQWESPVKFGSPLGGKLKLG